MRLGFFQVWGAYLLDFSYCLNFSQWTWVSGHRLLAVSFAQEMGGRRGDLRETKRDGVSQDGAAFLGLCKVRQSVYVAIPLEGEGCSRVLLFNLFSEPIEMQQSLLPLQNEIDIMQWTLLSKIFISSLFPCYKNSYRFS